MSRNIFVRISRPTAESLIDEHEGTHLVSSARMAFSRFPPTTVSSSGVGRGVSAGPYERALGQPRQYLRLLYRFLPGTLSWQVEYQAQMRAIVGEALDLSNCQGRLYLARSFRSEHALLA